MKRSVLYFVWSVVLTAIVQADLWAQQEVDLTLQEAIALALQRNYDVQLAKNASEAASTDDNYAWGAFLPRVNGTASLTRQNVQQDFEFQDVTRNRSGEAISNNTSASVQLVWTLFDGTRMFATRRRISEIAEQGEVAVKNQMINTIASVITRYYDIVRQKQQIKAIQEQIGVNEERVKLADLRLSVGTGGKPELLQAKVDLNEQRTQLLTQESTLLQLKEQLNVLLGMQMNEPYDVGDTILIDMGLGQEVIEESIERSNFSLQLARMNLAIAELELSERKAELTPTLNFNAAYNYSRNNNITLINPFSSLRSLNEGYNYGLTLSVPILNALNTRRLIQQARVNINRQQVTYDQQKAAVHVDVRNAFVRYENAKKVLVIEEENILLAKENVFIALEGFKRGITTFIELRTAQQSLESAYTRLIDARYNAKVAETELLRLSGDLLK